MLILQKIDTYDNWTVTPQTPTDFVYCLEGNRNTKFSYSALYLNPPAVRSPDGEVVVTPGEFMKRREAF